MTIQKISKSAAMRFLEGLAGPLTLGRLLEAIRLGEDMILAEFAKRLSMSRSHLCDIEKGRKMVSPGRAAQFTRVVGYPEDQFVRLALQVMVEDAGLKLSVQVNAAWR